MTELDKTGLAPCPFCGGEASLRDGGPGCFFVQCDWCNATSDDRSRDTAIKAWNSRAAATSAGEPGIKALEWKPYRNGDADAVTLFGEIYTAYAGGYWRVTRQGRAEKFIRVGDDIEAAKAAAQADFEARIRSSLAHPTPTPVSAPVGVVDLIKCAEILAGLEENRCRSFPTEQDCEFARTTLASLRSPAVEGK